jgi:anti-sigma regulatory factor (Ser/Thr protein kinase)
MDTAAETAQAPRRDGAWHEALPYFSAGQLVERLAPQVAAAVSAGDPVVAVLDEATGGQLRDALGADSSGVDFQDPLQVHRMPAFTVALQWARTSRLITAPGGRALVVSQQLDTIAGGPHHWARLDIGVNVATAGLPVTVLCPFEHGIARLPVVQATHPLLSTATGSEPSRFYREPEESVLDYPPPPPPDLGTPAAELTFVPDDLVDLRHLVSRVAGSTSLDPDRVADLVLAVNELASNSVEHGPGWGRLRLWTSADSGADVVAEVADASRMTVPFPGMRMPPPAGARGRGLWLAAELADALEVWSEPRDTVIRVRMSA